MIGKILLNSLKHEDRKMNKIHWTIVSVMAIMCCETGCRWAFSGKEIDTKGVISAPERIQTEIFPKTPVGIVPGRQETLPAVKAPPETKSLPLLLPRKKLDTLYVLYSVDCLLN